MTLRVVYNGIEHIVTLRKIISIVSLNFILCLFIQGNCAQPFNKQADPNFTSYFCLALWCCGRHASHL